MSKKVFPKPSDRNVQRREKLERTLISSSQEHIPILSSFLKLFLSVNTIQSFIHIPDRKWNYIETVMWLSIIIGGTFGAFVLSKATWRRYQENPTVISIERDHYSWNTSFPSVTICPSSKIDDDLLNDYLETVNVRNKTELALFLKSLAQANYNTFNKVLPYEEIPSEHWMDILLKLQYDFKPLVSNSEVQLGNFSLGKTITEMGICYSFNSNIAVYNSPEYWKNNSWEIFSGSTPMFVVHPLDGEIFANVVNLSTAFHVYVHGPFETIDSASKGLYSPDGYFLQLFITALTIFTSDGARDLKIHQRKCQFHTEHTLNHSSVYSYTLCRMECRISICKRLCGCIPHFYRRVGKENVCDVRGLHCLSYHSERLIMMHNECSCYSNCYDVNYVVEDTDTRKWFLGSNLRWGLRECPKMRLRRDVIFTFADVLVHFGGMSGLFLGCSLLSFIEILYSFTARLYWHVVKYKKDRAIGVASGRSF